MFRFKSKLLQPFAEAALQKLEELPPVPSRYTTEFEDEVMAPFKRFTEDDSWMPFGLGGALQEVYLTNLIATQPGVSKAQVTKCIEDPSGTPAAIVEAGGEQFIIDGHHRLAADILVGKRTVSVRVKYVDDLPKGVAIIPWKA